MTSITIIPEILIPGIIGILTIAYLYLRCPKWAFAVLIVSKPIVDLLWNYYIVPGINFLKIYAVLFVILGVIYIIANRLYVRQNLVTIAWLVFLFMNLIGTFVSPATHVIGQVGYLLRSLNGFVAFVLFMHLFDYDHEKEQIIALFLFSALCAVVIWLVSVARTDTTTSVAGIADELLRIQGPYNNWRNFSLFGMQAFFCSLVFLLLCFKRTQEQAKAVLTRLIQLVRYRHALTCSIVLTIFVISLIMVYKSYSKSALMITSLSLIAWFVVRRKVRAAAAIIALIIVLLVLTPCGSETKSLFRKELDYFVLRSEQWSSDTLFMGRVRKWKTGMDEYTASSFGTKLLGTDAVIDSDNYYLRVLLDNGLVGLATYLILLGYALYRLLRGYVHNKDPVILMAVFVLIAYMIDSMGFHTMSVPSVQWFTWGMVGFAFSKD